METKKLIFKGVLVLMLGFGLMIGGCAQLNPGEGDQSGSGIVSPTEPQPPSIDGVQNHYYLKMSDPSGREPEPEGKKPGLIPPCDLERHHYPAGADIPPPGRQFVNLGADNIPGDGNDFIVVYIYEELGGSLSMDNTGIFIRPYGVPYSTWIGMSEPLPNEPWVEFEPHGLNFTSPQYARISYEGCQLPNGMDPEDLEIWYWNEELGKFEYIGGDNNLDEQYIEFDIEHFSRYVVAGQN